MARSARASRIGEDQMRAFLRELEWRIAPLLPVAVARSIGALRGFFISRRSYAQNGEDLLAAQFFRRIGLSRGYYVDIGCFHPHWISNDPFKVRLYRLVRGSRVRTVCAAVTAVRSAEPARLYRFHKLWSELDTLSHEVATRSGRPFTVSTVQSLCIGDLLDLAPRPVNFLNIDVEGLDDSILRAIDFGRHRPELVCFEDALGSILPGADIAGFLGAQGYVHLFSTGPSHGFARLA
jgi:hypothetical protein